MAITVRPAEPEDARGIADVHIISWQVAYRGIFPDEFLDDLSSDTEDRLRRWQAAITLPERPGSRILVAEADEEVVGREIVGFLSCGPSRDEDATPATGEIFAIYVRPDRWGSGAGDSLLVEGVRGLTESGFEVTTLWVLQGNPRARRFYERHGWKEDGSVETFERGGVTTLELRYRCSLTG